MRLRTKGGVVRIALRDRLPTVTFSERLTLHLGGRSFRLINLPGHTLYRVVFTSDNIFHQVHAFLDQALSDKCFDSLDRLAELDAEYFVPGHGIICAPDYISEMKTVIETWVAVVIDAINKGVCLGEALDTISLLDCYPM